MPKYTWTVEFNADDDEDAKDAVEEALMGSFGSVVREELKTEDGTII